MTSITEQKANLRELIHKHIARYIYDNPDQAVPIAIGAIARLTGKMTLRELSDWHLSLKATPIVAADQQEKD